MIKSKRAASCKPCKNQAQEGDLVGIEEKHEVVRNNYFKSSFKTYSSSNLSLSSYTSKIHLSQNTGQLLNNGSSSIKKQNTPSRENPYRRQQKRVVLSNRIRNILRHDDMQKKPDIRATCSIRSPSSQKSDSSSNHQSSLSSDNEFPKSKMQLRRREPFPQSITFFSHSDSDSSPQYHKNKHNNVLLSSSSSDADSNGENIFLL